MLEANELGKVYRERSFFGAAREVAAAKDVTLTLRKGRTLGIVGESGSGKSTVARCIVRLIDPTSGGIRLAGREISGPVARGCCSRTASASRSSSRTPIVRSIRASPSARPSPRGR